MTTPTPAPPTGGAEDRTLDALISVIQAAAGPAAQEAQTLLLRRLALEGDVIPSRVPAPLNITEVGGYLNLLDTLDQRRTILQVLTSALGVAGQPSALLTETPTSLSMAPLPNDRPPGAASPTATATVLLRSDLLVSMQTVLAAVHQVGAVLPLWTPPALPALTATTDALEACGRVVRVLPTAALTDPATDSIVLGREIGGVATSYSLFARPDPADPDTAALPELEIGAAVLGSGSGAPMEVDLGLVRLLPLQPVLLAAGWSSTPAPALPTSRTDLAWTRLVNVSGLLPGVTRLGDELSLVRAAAEIEGTPFAARVDWTWDGTDFVAPGG